MPKIIPKLELKNLANCGVTLWVLLAILPAKASRRPEPSLADRADVRRDLVRLLNKPSRNFLIWICALCTCWNLPARGKRHAGGIEGRTGGIHLLLLCSHTIRITTLFGQNMANNKEDHAGNEKAGNCSVPSPSPSCPCPWSCPCPLSCPCPWPLASSEESWPRSSCWWPWARSALLLMGSVVKTSSDYFPETQRQNISFTRLNSPWRGPTSTLRLSSPEHWTVALYVILFGQEIFFRIATKDSLRKSGVPKKTNYKDNHIKLKKITEKTGTWEFEPLCLRVCQQCASSKRARKESGRPGFVFVWHSLDNSLPLSLTIP